ncbi:MAG: Rrf2 family transcriptional regulator [Sulfuricurvum sp.]|nr:Rrf2 family transcriptional regulator [Sulfuricurvum sp.]
MLSSACQDTIRAAVWLSTKPQDEYYHIQKISDSLELPYHFLAKSLQTLVRCNILVSRRGANGGVKLAKSSSDISLISLIEAIDGSRFFDACILGIGDCEDEKPCALHAQWEKWRTEMHEMYSAMRLEEITDDVLLRKIKRL